MRQRSAAAIARTKSARSGSSYPGISSADQWSRTGRPAHSSATRLRSPTSRSSFTRPPRRALQRESGTSRAKSRSPLPHGDFAINRFRPAGEEFVPACLNDFEVLSIDFCPPHAPRVAQVAALRHIRRRGLPPSTALKRVRVTIPVAANTIATSPPPALLHHRHHHGHHPSNVDFV